MKRTLLLGLDAAGWSYLTPLLDRQELPNIRRLMSHGCFGSLRSTLPPVTPTAWSSIITGKKPSKHGLFHFEKRIPGSYAMAPVRTEDRLGTPFWTRLSEKGIRVGLVNVPYSYPPGDLEGFCVAGFGTPEDLPELTFPASLQERLESRFGLFSTHLDVEADTPPGVRWKRALEHQARHVAIIKDLLPEYPVEVLAINLMFFDHANHFMPNFEDVESALLETDRHIGETIEAFQPSHILLISDHGARRVTGTFLCHTWLEDQGYIVQKERSSQERTQILNWLALQLLKQEVGLTGIGEKTLRAALRVCLRLAGPGRPAAFWERVERIIPRAADLLLFQEQVDFSKSRLYTTHGKSGPIYVNLCGREPAGNVPATGCDDLVSEVVGRLREVRDPVQGQPLFRNVEKIDCSPKMVAAGSPHIAISSDSVWDIQTTPYHPHPAGSPAPYFVDDSSWYGDHAFEGIYIFSGGGFRTGEAEPASVWDVTPTLLYLCGVPVPEDFDGDIMRGTIQDELLAAQPPGQQPGDASSPEPLDEHFPTDTSSSLEHRLRGLGYLE